MALTKNKIDEIIAINKARNAELFSFYDPVSGEGSPIPRTKINFKVYEDDEEDMCIYFPNRMIETIPAVNILNIDIRHELHAGEHPAFIDPHVQRMKERKSFTCIEISKIQLSKIRTCTVRNIRRGRIPGRKAEFPAHFPFLIKTISGRSIKNYTAVE